MENSLPERNISIEVQDDAKRKQYFFSDKVCWPGLGMGGGGGGGGDSVI